MPSPYLMVANFPAVASGNVIAETAFGQAPGNTVRVTCSAPTAQGNGALDGRMMKLRCSILVTTGGSLTYGPSIRLNSGGNTNLTTFTSDTAIITPAAPTIATATRLMFIEANLWWDVTTARLNGNYSFQVDGTYTAFATLTAQLTSGVAAASSIQFVCTGIFGTTQANNTAILKCFEIDLQ